MLSDRRRKVERATGPGEGYTSVRLSAPPQRPADGLWPDALSAPSRPTGKAIEQDPGEAIAPIVQNDGIPVDERVPEELSGNERHSYW